MIRKDSFYVIFNKEGVDRLAKTDRYNLTRGEKVCRVDFNFDDAIFTPPPIFQVSLELKAHHFESEAVTLSPEWQQDGAWERGDQGQRSVNVLAAQLMEKGLNSSDPAMKDLAFQALQICRDQGIEVQIHVPAMAGEDES